LASFDDVIDRLSAFYGPLRMPPDDPFGFYVWEVLGNKTTAGRRDAALMALRKVPALTPDAIGKLPRGRLEAVVRHCGSLIDERLAALDAGAAVFRRQPSLMARLQGPLRAAWPAARDLPHVGQAGALGLLLFTGGGVIVPADEGTTRVVTRYGLVPPAGNARRTARGVRRWLTATLPAELLTRRKAVLYLQHHAHHTCVEGVPHCTVCPVASACVEGRRRAGEETAAAPGVS
jgi:endonuclease III